MSGADSNARRLARKNKSRKRSLDKPLRLERARRKEAHEELAAQQRYQAEQKKWQECPYHGLGTPFGELLILPNVDGFLFREVNANKNWVLSCNACGDHWLNIGIHP